MAEIIDTPVEVGATRAVMAPDARTVEVVLDVETPMFAMSEVAWQIQREGLSLNVLVGLDRLGEAHIELRGTPCTLQGWWIADDDVRFTGYEIP